MTKASNALEGRRRTRAFDQFRRDWWWFDDRNREHIHQFSVSWEILRRSCAFKQLHEGLLRWRGQFDKAEHGSFAGVIQKSKLMSLLHDMIPCSRSHSRELRKMMAVWQNMLANGWTPEKNYLEASHYSEVKCMLPDGKTVSIPPTYGGENHGVPVILPRQVSSHGHTSLVVELFDVVTKSRKASIAHIAGSTGPTHVLSFLDKTGKTVPLKEGKFIAIQFPMNHPPEALKALLKPCLDSLQQTNAWIRPSDSPGIYSRGPSFMTATTNPVEAIAFFHADQPLNVIERGFKTLIRPERLAKQMPKLRDEWVAWDLAERVKYAAPGCSHLDLKKKARAAWDEAERYGKPARQSTTRPFRPEEDLANLACADCAPFYRRNRTKLPEGLPPSIRKDPDLNKRIGLCT